MEGALARLLRLNGRNPPVIGNLGRLPAEC